MHVMGAYYGNITYEQKTQDYDAYQLTFKTSTGFFIGKYQFGLFGVEKLSSRDLSLTRFLRFSGSIIYTQISRGC